MHYIGIYKAAIAAKPRATAPPKETPTWAAAPVKVTTGAVEEVTVPLVGPMTAEVARVVELASTEVDSAAEVVSATEVVTGAAKLAIAAS